MEEKQQVSNEALFIAFIVNLHASTMIALGKIASPLTQKIERNLEQARFTIDLLGMLEAKTAGNRTEEESRALKTVLTELRLNYIDELEKDRLTESERIAATDGRPVHGEKAGDSPDSDTGRTQVEKNQQTGDDAQAERSNDKKKEA